MTQMFETDVHGRTLVVGGWKADLYAADEGYEILGRVGLNGSEALRAYNEANNTSLEPSFFDSWLKHYRELAKNPLTGTRVGRDHPAYKRSNRITKYMKAHPEIVEKVRKENGL